MFTNVALRSLIATHHPQGGVLLQWHAGSDANNLGWHVYREVNGERVQLTPEVIAGSALRWGPGLQLNAGNSYWWWDAAGSRTNRYWLGDKDLSGQLTIHDPVAPVETRQPPPMQRYSALLSQVGGKQTVQPKLRAEMATRRAQRQTSLSIPPMVTSSQRLQPWEPPGLPPHARQYALAAVPAINIDVWETGWYRVTQPELVAAGLDPRVDPHRLQLFVDGRQQAIWVTGGEDGHFDAQDAIEFYGIGLDTPWTDTQTYWLVAGSQPGHRVQTEPSRSQGAAPPPSFPFTIALQDRSLYLAIVKNGEASNFFGALLANEPVEQVLMVHHLDPASSADAQLEVALQGVTTGSHQVAVQLNGHDLGTMVWSGQKREVLTWPIPMAWLREGENVMTLVPIDGEEISVVDTIRLRYERTYTADHDSLRFTVPGQSRVTITGFSQPDIRVVDMTEPHAVRDLSGHVTVQPENHAVTVSVTGEDERTLFAFTDEQVKEPATITANTPSTWHQPAHGADLIIISHGAFLERVRPLQTVRETQGWRVVLVDIQDVYDEFHFGTKSPWALRHFLQHVSTAWQTPPRFVLLVGDASFDPRNHLELDDVDFVPTRLEATALFETASDDWFVDFDDDHLPELAIGRLPVQTVEEASTVVAKLVGYAQANTAGSWQREALFVVDDQDIFDFAAASREVKALLPPHLAVEEFLLDQTDQASLRRDLLTRLNEGQLLVNYMGHGSTELWADGELLTSADARVLINDHRLPVVVSMTCMNGFFHDLYSEAWPKPY